MLLHHSVNSLKIQKYRRVMRHSTDIDIWEIITDVLEKHEPIMVTAFFGYFYFHLHPSRIAVMLDEEVDTIQSWLSKIQTDIKRAARSCGVIVRAGGKLISAPTSNIFDDKSPMVDEENEE